MRVLQGNTLTLVRSCATLWLDRMEQDHCESKSRPRVVGVAKWLRRTDHKRQEGKAERATVYVARDGRGRVVAAR